MGRNVRSNPLTASTFLRENASLLLRLSCKRFQKHVEISRDHVKGVQNEFERATLATEEYDNYARDVKVRTDAKMTVSQATEAKYKGILKGSTVALKLSTAVAQLRSVVQNQKVEIEGLQTSISNRRIAPKDSIDYYTTQIRHTEKAKLQKCRDLGICDEHQPAKHAPEEANHATETPFTSAKRTEACGDLQQARCRLNDGFSDRKKKQEGVLCSLIQENHRLRKELEAFDLGFFEQIEDLKYLEDSH